MNKIVTIRLLFVCTFLICINTFGFTPNHSKVKSNSIKNTDAIAVCSFSLTPDLPFLTSSTTIENEIIAAVKIF